MSDGSLENYRSLHGLPELAGVADLAGAAGPGLGVQECDPPEVLSLCIAEDLAGAAHSYCL